MPVIGVINPVTDLVPDPHYIPQTVNTVSARLSICGRQNIERFPAIGIIDVAINKIHAKVSTPPGIEPTLNDAHVSLNQKG
jgi:hypothetical protein